jgi:pimeloyl-ACP methyl ester carboxylesterase
MRWLLEYKLEMAIGAVAYGCCCLSLQWWQAFLVRALLFVLGATAMLIFRQNAILYVPSPNGAPRRNHANPPMYRSPEEWGMPFETITTVVAQDRTVLRWWLMLQKTHFLGRLLRENAPTIIYFHGNAGNCGSRLLYYAEMFNALECNLLAVEYRGYGDCAGSPSEKGLQSDAREAINCIRTRTDIDQNKVFIFGRSLGGAVGIYLASQLAVPTSTHRQVRGIIIENSFLSIADMVGQVVPFLSAVPAAFLDRVLWSVWPSKQRVRSLGHSRLPALFLSSLRDEIVPPEQMARLCALYKAAWQANQGEQAQVWFEFFPNATHNDMPVAAGANYYIKVASFVKQVLNSDKETAGSKYEPPILTEAEFGTSGSFMKQGFAKSCKRG